MKYLFSIDDSSQDAQALLTYLRSLKFVKEEGLDQELTDEHLLLLNERKASYLSGKSETFSIDEIESFVRSKSK
ncbi:hypothetical protein [Fluviicola sp.]|uniref:hypothetical protein n=1 Tax=Fluviicola sp. TaxID=1917219 RepID=UPI002630123E|nr:hypothetical protein [Fluviicola sp.]